MEVKKDGIIEEFDSMIDNIIGDRTIWVKLNDTSKRVLYSKLDRYLDFGWEVVSDCVGGK